MRIFSLDKWFFDVMFPDSSYVFFYIARVRLFGLSFSRINLHYKTGEELYSYSEKIRLKVTDKKNFAVWPGTFRQEGNNLKLVIAKGELVIGLIFKSSRISGSEKLKEEFIQLKRKSIKWTPVLLKAEVEGSITLGELTRSVSNYDGYIDYMSSRILPFRVPVVEIYWGRLHHEKIDLCWSIAYPEDPTTPYVKCICRFGDRLEETGKVMLMIKELGRSEVFRKGYIRRYKLEVKFRKYQVSLTINKQEDIFVSEFLDEHKRLNPLLTGVLKIISGNPGGIKFMSQAELEVTSGSGILREQVNLISEYVRFKKNRQTS